jgi:hypothetical protein
MKKILLLIIEIVIFIGVNAQAKKLEEISQFLSKNQKDNKVFDVPLKGVKSQAVVDINGYSCVLDGSASAHLVKKMDAGVITWVLKGVTKLKDKVCINDTEFQISHDGLFVSPMSAARLNAVSEYALQSCLIKNKGKLYAERKLTADEAGAVSECFLNSTENSDLNEHCGKLLFAKDNVSRILNCDSSFLEMASISRHALVKCDVKFIDKEFGAPPAVICPYGEGSGITVSGGIKAYYSKGYCFNRDVDSCVQIKKIDSSVYSRFLLKSEVVVPSATKSAK